ncbi:MAG: hypothetical protein QW035_02940 [Candidatus Anstonellales archaeon]
MIITGSVGTGKTSVTKEVAKALGQSYISSADVAKKAGLIKKGEVSVEALRKSMKRLEGVKEGHVLCEANFGEKTAVVLRCHPDELRRRLRERGYSVKKVEINVEAEMLDYCFLKAKQNYAKAIEVDTTGISAKEAAKKVIKMFKAGRGEKVDWSKELKESVREKAFVRNAYKVLFSYYGPQGWWPAKTRFEVMVGAILTQNTAWSNVEKAIAELKRVDLLRPEKLANAKLKAVEEAIRSSGYYRQKAKRIKKIARFFLAHRRSAGREELLALEGVGPETADSILLYAYGKPYFVVDAYTRRMLEVHGIKRKTYDDYAWLFVSALPRNAKLYKEFHALIVRLGKEWLKEKRWKLEGYPLASLLP